ncbi:hypothetical protein [Nocardioides pantholopis]|uniref:hypothetical protein n=1 Tax=Nocardioides pantholopis TaxID=2483798 RepID=UPI000FD8F367|nr:hypothetical protein [Nocardioides pantholopis]
MPLRACTDPAAFDWLRHSRAEPERLITWGPDGFEAYARVRFVPDPTPTTPAEADVVLADDHPTDLVQVGRVLRHLAAYTEAPEECCYCVWDGYSDLDLSRFPDRSRARLRDRGYVILQGSLTDFDTWEECLGGDAAWPPAFVWPADRRWCLTKDVDPHWAAVGGSAAAVRSLVEDERLDAIRADPSAPVPAFR